MEVQEYLKYRVDLLDESQDEEGFINESNGTISFSSLLKISPLILDFNIKPFIASVR